MKLKNCTAETCICWPF